MFWKHVSLIFLLPIFMTNILCGCSTVKTSVLSPGELQDQIATRQIVKPGDHVTVTTNQDIRYKLEITRVTEQSIEGLEDVLENQQTINENADISMQTVHRNAVEIPLEEISTIETRELTPVGEVAGATGAAVAVGGVIYFTYVLLPALLVGALVGF